MSKVSPTGRWNARTLVRGPAALLAVAVAACGAPAPIADVDLAMRVDADAQEVAPGRGFAVAVTRTWDRSLTAAAWDDRTLSPLVLVPAATERRDDGARVEETRRFRAYAMTRGDVSVPAPSFSATPAAGGAARRVIAAPLRLHVHPEVDAENPGAPELPSPPAPEPTPGPTTVGLVFVALAAALALVVLARRRRAGAAAPPPSKDERPAAPEPDEAALARLAALKARASTTPQEWTADLLGVSSVLREYVAARFAFRAVERTTEELAAAAASWTPAVAAEGRARLRSVLSACDLVKFAGREPAADERLRAIRDAEAFVRETAAAPKATGSAGGPSS